MKMNLKTFIQASVSVGSLTLAALLVGGSAQNSRAGTADPSTGSSFMWECQSSGPGQRGLAFITFSNNETFRGYQMWASLPPNTNSSGNDSRGGDDSRGGGTSGGSSGHTNNFVFGFSPISGMWSINLKKQIVGFFSVVLNVTSEVTNYHAGTVFETITNSQTFDIADIFVTFADGQSTVTTNFAWANPPGFIETYVIPNPNITVAIGSANQTNNISFTGTSSLGRSLTLMCSSTFGRVVYQGKPTAVASDPTGQWFGTKHQNGQQFNEFFDVQSFAFSNPFPIDFPDIADFPNIYFTDDGVGPGYNFNGIVMVSKAQKKIGFTFVENPDAAITTLRATIGALTANKKGVSGKTKGIEEPLNPITFNANLQP
jgi:hypothetical protein